MAIWNQTPDLAAMNAMRKNTALESVGLEFTEVGDDYLRASMPVDHRTKQPFGILHGGVSCVLAETLGSMASQLCIDSSKQQTVGIDINANHVRAVASGTVYGEVRPLHVGRTTQVWEIKITNEDKKLVCIARLTTMVIDKK